MMLAAQVVQITIGSRLESSFVQFYGRPDQQPDVARISFNVIEQHAD